MKYFHSITTLMLEKFQLYFCSNYVFKKNQQSAPNITNALIYAENFKNYMDNLRILQVKLIKLIQNDVHQNLQEASHRQILGIFTLITVLFISPIIIVMMTKVVNTIQVLF